jgi:histidinol-phosphate/aromatic aminotransferase/cobyric acid decarboxylase-like protein
VKSPLDEIAEASIDIPELVRGVCGAIEVEGLERVRLAHAMFVVAGWERKEEKEGWSKLEHRVYLRRGKVKGNDRWLRITVGNFAGIFGLFEVSKRKPW